MSGVRDSAHSAELLPVTFPGGVEVSGLGEAGKWDLIEYSIIGEGSQISTNQKRESTVFSLLIG